MIWSGFFSIFFPIYSYICIVARDRVIDQYKILISRFLTFFYTEEVINLKEMRKNLKKKIIAVVEKLGPQLFKNFEELKMVKRKPSHSQPRSQQSMVDQYYDELELNEAFASLQDVVF